MRHFLARANLNSVQQGETTMKLGLQIVLGLFSLIPLAFAAMGLMSGMAGADPAATVSAAVDNQYRYMSGVYILVTLLLWYAIPKIETHFRLMSLICPGHRRYRPPPVTGRCWSGYGTAADRRHH
jgi:uncharacterized membrane protein YqjE